MSAAKRDRYEENGQRFYPIEELGRDAPSVTTCTGKIDKPKLVAWAANMAVEFIQKHVLDQLEKGEISIADLRKAAVKDLVQQARSYHNKRKEEAGDRGTRVHEFVEEWVAQVQTADPDDPFSAGATFIDFDEDIEDRVRLFVEWWVKNKVVPKYQEKRVWSDEGGGYAGTLDGYWNVNGRWFIVDIKTSKGLWPEHKLQLAAYVYAFMKRYPDDPVEGAAFLHISELTGDAEFVEIPLEEVKDLYRLFICLSWYVNIELEIKAKAEPKPKGRPKKKRSRPAGERAEHAADALNEAVDELAGSSVNGPVGEGES